MWKNYLLTAYRTLVRHKAYSLITVFGLALGIACCVLLLLFVQDEWTHDRFHQHAERTYRVNRASVESSGEVSWSAIGPAALGPALQETFPSVEAAVRIAGATVGVEHGADRVEAKALFADTAFFDVFSFVLRRGSPDAALATPDGAVLSASAARRFFGDRDPVGQPLSVRIEDETVELRVTGVASDPPANSSIQFDLILPFELLRYTFSGFFREAAFSRWDFPVTSTFVLLRGAEQAGQIEAALPDFTAQHSEAAAPSGEGDSGVHVAGPAGDELRLQPLPAIHLDPEVAPHALKPPSDPLYSYLLVGVALLVLLMACINFTTLALGRSVGRAKEVGVRKVLGAGRSEIRQQFWSEALLVSGAALGVGLLLAQLFLPAFNEVAGKHLALDPLRQPSLALALVGLALTVGLVAGGWPALVLSRFAPAHVLRGRVTLGGPGRLTRGLVVLQFALTIALVSGALVVASQLEMMRADLGFNKDQVVRIDGLPSSSQEGQAAHEAFRREALRHAAVQGVAGSLFPLFGGDGFDAPIMAGDTARVQARLHPVTDTFVETLEIELVAGRGFEGARGTDASAVLVNEALVREMGWETAVGKRISVSEGTFVARAVGEVEVIGVVEDFHTASLRQHIEPLVLASSARIGGVGALYARVSPGDLPGTLALLEAAWREAVPGRPFQYAFLDEVVGEAYEAERRWRSIVSYAGAFALLITCFGLYGLAALAAERRTKEVGIRRVVGASVPQLVALLSKDFGRLVLVAFVLAAPLAYVAAERWLAGFAYRIELGPGLFLVAGALALVVALATVSVHAFRTATADPVQALRYE